MENHSLDFLLMLASVFYMMSFTVLQWYKQLLTKEGFKKHFLISIIVSLVSCLLFYFSILSLVTFAFSWVILCYILLFYMLSKLFKRMYNRDIVLPSKYRTDMDYEPEDWIFSLLIMAVSLIVPFIIVTVFTESNNEFENFDLSLNWLLNNFSIGFG